MIWCIRTVKRRRHGLYSPKGLRIFSRPLTLGPVEGIECAIALLEKTISNFSEF
jgi:hypothetical protein